MAQLPDKRNRGVSVKDAGASARRAEVKGEVTLVNHKREILIVDDDADVRFAVAARLVRAGYTTTSASNGSEALQVALAQRPDAIVLDVRMPDMDGMTVLSKLKAEADTRNVPVVMLSASVVDQNRAIDAGARFFLSKPYRAEDLVTAVTKALDAPHTPPSACAAVGEAG